MLDTPITAADSPAQPDSAPVQRQPLLHDLLVALSAPTQAWSGDDGQVRHTGAHGFYHSDVRVLSTAIVQVSGEEPEMIASAPAGPGAVQVTSLARGVDGPGADPTTRLERVRTVRAGEVTETITFSCATADPVDARITLVLGNDFATMEQVKGGTQVDELPAALDGDALTWSDGTVDVVVSTPGATLNLDDPARPTATWTVRAANGSPVVLSWTLSAVDHDAVVEGADAAGTVWSRPVVTADDQIGRASCRERVF